MVFYFFICVLSKFKSVLPILLVLLVLISIHYYNYIAVHVANGTSENTNIR